MHIRKGRFILSIILLIIVLLISSVPLGPLPSIISMTNPSTGIISPNNQSVSLGLTYINVTQNGSTAHIIINVQSDGIIGIASDKTWGLYYEQGYQEAKYRLEQMEFLKRTALGTLAQVVGPSAVGTDIFFRQLEDLQVAEQENANLSRNSLAYIALSEFADGINAYIKSLSPAEYPMLFKILNFQPTLWNVTDVLAVQQLFLWENSAGGVDPIYFNYALQTMPENIIKGIYPVYPEGIQHPIVPYSLNPEVYNESGNLGNLSLYTPSFIINQSEMNSINSYFSDPPGLPSWLSILWQDLNLKYATFKDLGSNNWAVNGIKTDNTSALLANDPHLSTTVPSIWIGFQLVSPGQNVVGVIFPGFPGIILGHNPYIAWGATNGQIQQTYFYAEQTSPNHPYQYYSNGQWVHFNILNETIYVKGASPVNLQVERANNGVVLIGKPTPVAMDWTGLIPSYEINAVLNMDYAKNVTQFRQNISEWFRVGIQNWAVADKYGNIGIFPYGRYPIIEHGNPRGILPGNGSCNWIGFIPVSQLPFLYDPSNGFVFSSNQITVSENYPYYIGWDQESGFRADEAYYLLNTTNGFNTQKMEEIQLSVHDYSTNVFLPPLLSLLRKERLNNSPEYQALESWNGNFTINSTAATLYHFWLLNYINLTFQPYMTTFNITELKGYGQFSFFLGSDDYYHGPLIEDLMNWTLNYPDSPYFDVYNINGSVKEYRNAYSIMSEAYNMTVSNISKDYGMISNNWQWGNFHKRELSSFFGVNSLNTSAIPAPGDGNTLNAAYGMTSSFGPSWRQVVNMSNPINSQGIYPGGLTENPISHYYSNNFVPWNNGIYYTLIPSTVPPKFLYLYEGGVNP